MSIYIIGEAGVNHNGSLDLAIRLIDKAVEAKVDAIKFQTFTAKNLVSKAAQKAEYQKKTTGENETQFAMLSKLQLDEEAHAALMKHCADRNITFLSTPFDHESIDLLHKMDLEIFKIPSGEITNLPYLRHIGGLKKKVIMSTGMADLGEVKEALNVLVEAGTPKEDITILHATTEYPCPMEEVNLNAMATIRDALHVKVGYSDHTRGIEIPIAAAALGASVIEKHFTLDRNMEGPDHKASLEPEELKAMVAAIRNIESALGDGVKKPSPSELKNKEVVRKSIVAKCMIQKGETFSPENLTVKRPGNGINPMLWDSLIGRVAEKDYSADERIK